MGELLEVIFLGTGTSQGVPVIGCDCETCQSQDPKDRRFRTSIFLKSEQVCLMIDTPPDLRMQCLRENIRHVDAVLFTHSHMDHIMGFDDLRRFCEMADVRLPVYGSPRTLADLERIFPYAFEKVYWHVKNHIRVTPKEIQGEFSLGNLRIVPVSLPHGKFTTTGYVFHRENKKVLAYYTDCGSISPEAEKAAQGVEVLVLDALRHRFHPTHLTVKDAIEVAQRLQARTCYFTHMSHDLKHKETKATLPEGIFLAYDGLRIHC